MLTSAKQVVVIVLMFLATVTTAAQAGDLSLPAANSSWDPFFVGHIDSWDVNLGKYQKTIPPDAPRPTVRLANIRAIFEDQGSFDEYKRQCEGGSLTKVIKEFRSEKDKETLLSIVKDKGEAAEVGFLIGDAIGLLPEIGQRVWPIAVVGVLRDVVDRTEYVQNIKRTRSNLASLIAVGGRVEHQERLYRATEGEKPWMIYRAIVYRVKVGEEDRVMPLCVDTVLVRIGKSSK